MSSFINRIFHLTFLITIIITCNNTFAQSNNNSYVFNGMDSKVGITDDLAANKTAWEYFDNPLYENDPLFDNEIISVEAWVYLIGESPGIKMPIVYRSINSTFNTFSLYIEDRTAYFSLDGGTTQNGDPAVVSTENELPINAFGWIHLVGTYDGTTLKLYYGGNLVDQLDNVSLSKIYSSGDGLFIGKSDEGAFRGLIDEVRVWRFALQDNHINNSGGNGNPSENFPQSIAEYLNGRWSFTELDFNTNLAQDYSDFNNDLTIWDITEIVNSKHPPFIVVNSTGDLPDLFPGDGTADAGNGEVTLRAAIQEANAYAGHQIVYFYIPGSAPYLIQPGTVLPDITESVYLDGTVQSGYAGSPVVQINGSYG
ncbi:MAG: LamG domain-containing protein, partial [Ignavibacteria bacterium]|nr:LamG domain-containing protein [Ignavibacteria bacterium]